ncbi:hypothetical protein CVO76_12025 [Arthrobacter agilis]|uniref:Hpt domain-containing protein n=1 Tax=Arthrobacter agilis TaxID=37921 RepID=A0A2L0UGD0_9MICC|nr:hypothetical protein [Arthrobacter agilis]AUZ88282.1 hypothetical protein CVO76_12025 [Arthrobacter agilis]
MRANGAPDVLPHFEHRAFDVLVADLSPAAATCFVADFISMLPSRLERITEALAAGKDRDEMITALASLGVSASMTGATRLALTVDTALADLSRAAHPSTLLPVRLRREAQQFAYAYASFQKASSLAA